MNLYLERPALLALLPICLGVVIVLWRGSRVYMPPGRRLVALWLRLMVIGSLIVALAGPTIQLAATDLAVAVLLDRSDSITPTMQVDEERWLQAALSSKDARDQAAVISFGRDAVVERPLSPDAMPPRLSVGNVVGTRTDIAAAIRAGLAVLPPSSARRMVLLSDGQENLEKAESAAALAKAAGVQIVAVPLKSDQGPEVLVRQLDAPSQLREGQRFSVGAQVESTIDTSATLDLLIDGQLAAREDVSLQPGRSRFIMPVEPLPVGDHIVRLQVEADSDTLPQNNSAGAYIVVLGPPRILMVEGGSGEATYLAQALRTAGLQVDLAPSSTAALDSGVLPGYAEVILVNVAADALTAGRLATLKSYVRDQGGGLLVVGGDKAFGPGGYARTALEDMLPVRMDLRGKSVSASVALMIVMDVSGSMAGGPGGASKMDLAKEAALAAVEMMGEYDQVGVLAFDDQNHWMIEPTFASDLGPIEDAIGRMQPGGGTEIYPALKAGAEALMGVDARVKHVILLTDGQAPRGPYEELAARMQAANITVSTVGIGSDADTALLQELAALGNGRYYDGNDPFDLPRLLVKETQQVQRAAIVEEDFTPVTIAPSTATEGIDFRAAPALRGYVATTPKPQASVLLASRQLDPVLSEWQFGLGRVMAWTSDATNRWSSRWLQWPDFTRFWTQLAQHVIRPPQDPNRQVSVSLEGDQAHITLDAQTGSQSGTERHYLNFLPTRVTLVDPRGTAQSIELPQTAPGRYEAVVPVQDDGTYTLTAVQTEPGGSSAMLSGGFVVPYSPEYGAAGTDDAFLERLTGSTGGRVINTPAEVFQHDLPAVGASMPLSPPLLILVAALLVADVGVRRVRITSRELGSAYVVVRRWVGSTDTAPIRMTRVSTPGRVQGETSRLAHSTVASPRGSPATVAQVTRSSRLLAARQRASRR